METNLSNIDIEIGILSAILFDGENYEIVANILKPKDFYLPFHRQIFEAMERLYKKDYPIDELLIREELGKNGEIDENQLFEITRIYSFFLSSLKGVRDLLFYRNSLSHLYHTFKG